LNAIDINTISARRYQYRERHFARPQAALRRRPNSDKILILVTDGEDLEGDALIAAQAAAGPGTGSRSTPSASARRRVNSSPLTANPNGGFVKDESGGFVKIAAR